MRVGSRWILQSITASSMPPKMKASTAGNSGLSPSRQKATRNSTAVSALSQCFWTTAWNVMPRLYEPEVSVEFINLGDFTICVRL